jgi:serine/threonine protein kinase/tetratricopeptide (TPR) repeat protein
MSSDPSGDEAAQTRPSARSASRITRPSSTGPLDSGQIVNGRYHVIRLLGKGGMGAVYHAWDEELGVGVAMKVILPVQDEDPQVLEEMERRFKKELLLARQITHRNVVRIHDIGEVGGIKFITMPYVKGEDLATILKSGPLPVARALALARQIVSGLGAAHEAGVIHRDLKPANIMVEDDEWALLMDFGIARSIAAGTSHGGTIAGTVVGTIDYMAPEQARGETVDGRADIYAFGLIMYEMLTGRRQLAGDSAVADLMARMNAAPPPVRSLRPDVPDALDAIVTRCLQPNAESRYRTCAELTKALDRLDSEGHAIPGAQSGALTPKLVALAAAVILSVVGTAYWTASRRASAVETQRAPVSVLVADFENRTGDPVFDGTLAQSLNLAIEGTSFVTAFPRREAVRVAAQVQPGKPLDDTVAQLVARREGIAIVLAGSITREEGEYHITVRAIDGSNGQELAAATEQAGSKDDVLPAMSRLAMEVRRAVGDTEPQPSTETFTSGSLEAAHAYLEGQDMRLAGKLPEAIAKYEAALRLDPKLGRAYSGLATVYNVMGRREDSEKYFKLALQYVDGMNERERYRTLSAYHLFKREQDQAIQDLNALIEKYPADSAGLSNLALAYFYRREMRRASELGRRVVEIYPRNVLYRTNVALYAMYAGDFETARVEAGRGLKESPGYPKALLALAITSVMAGDHAEAARVYGEMAARNKSLSTIGLADAALFEGRAADAVDILTQGIDEDLEAKASTAAGRKLTALARAHLELGRPNEALAAVRRATTTSEETAVLTEAAEIYVDAGRLADATALAARLGERFDVDARAYGMVIEAEVLRARKQPREAVAKLQAAQKLADTWAGRLAMARAYMDASAWTEAYSALQSCLTRRGEATARFLDDVPTARVLPFVYYHLGVVQEQMNTGGAAESFRTFLRLRHAARDAATADAGRRLTN